MNKLGKIFKKNFWLIVGIILGVILLVFLKPFQLIGNWLGLSVDSTKSKAKRLKVAMQNFGTDEKELWTLLEPMKKKELEEVYIEFGLQRYDYGGRFWFGAPLDLFGWFAKELTQKEKTRMRHIWSVTDIDITF